MSITTCQICARPVKAPYGRIAHHGYRRPGDGYQSSSCPGALFPPYEQSCAWLRTYIESTRQKIAQLHERVACHEQHPPEELLYSDAAFFERRQRGGLGAMHRVARPAGFSVEEAERFAATSQHTLYANRNRYETVWLRVRDRLRRQIKQQSDYLAQLEKRLAAWVDPDAA